MGNISYNRLSYASNVYDIFISMFNPKDKQNYNDIDEFHNIPTSFITRLEIGSSIVSPLLQGSIRFFVKGTNPYQLMLREMCTYLQVSINLVNIHSESLESVQNDYTFLHTFLVTKTNILNTSVNYIEYELEFISADWWNFEHKIYVSTKGVKKNIVDIISDSFNAAGLKFNKNAVDGNPTNKELLYTSSYNDSLLTILAYMFNKTLEPDEDTDVNTMALFSYIYNHITGTYDLWNLSNIINILNSKIDKPEENKLDLITVPLTNTNTFIAPTDPHVELTQASLFNRLDVVKGLADTNVYNFNYADNKFILDSLKQLNKIKIIDSSWHTFLSQFYISKYNEIEHSTTSPQYPTDTAISFTTHHSCADITASLYTNNINVLLAADAVLLKSRCDIRRKPGDIVGILVNEDKDTMLDKDEKQTYDKSLMRTYNGYYIVTDNRMVLEFNEQLGSHMFRNYMYLNRPVNIK